MKHQRQASLLSGLSPEQVLEVNRTAASMLSATDRMNSELAWRSMLLATQQGLIRHSPNLGMLMRKHLQHVLYRVAYARRNVGR